MEYDKPHLSFEAQIEHLRSRGLTVTDPSAASRLLGRVGYYRLSDLDNGRRAKIYAASGIIAHITRNIDESTAWPSNFAALARRFPANRFVSPERDMGFPDSWLEQELWR